MHLSACNLVLRHASALTRPSRARCSYTAGGSFDRADALRAHIHRIEATRRTMIECVFSCGQITGRENAVYPRPATDRYCLRIWLPVLPFSQVLPRKSVRQGLRSPWPTPRPNWLPISSQESALNCQPGQTGNPWWHTATIGSDWPLATA